MKTGRSMGEVVFIDKGEMDKVPGAVREAFSKQSGPIPQVALSTADGAKVYGTSNHTALVNGLDKALRDAKRAMRDDLKNAKPEAAAAGDSKPSSSSEPESESGSESKSAIKVTEKNGVKLVAGAPFEQWVSTRGVVIMARLTSVSKTQVTLANDKGKTYTVKQADMSEDSVKRLQEILNP
jgi:hypothetical protein